MPKNEKLTIDREFESLLPPLSKSEVAQLEESLLALGRARDPIVTWIDYERNAQAVIVDGHNRYRICRRHSLPFEVDVETLAHCETREEVKQWMLDNQLGRRNLSPDAQILVWLRAGVRPKWAAVGQVADAEKVLEHPDLADRVIADHTLTLRQAVKELTPKSPRRRKPATSTATPTPAEPAELIKLAKANEALKYERQKTKKLTEALTQARESHDQLSALLAVEPPPIKPREKQRGVREATALALLSDLHVETLVRPSDTPYGNVFTLDIADLRLHRFFEALEWNVMHLGSAFKIRDLVLWLGGDMLTNHLHPENVETQQLGPGSTLEWLTARIIAGIELLLRSTCSFERILIPCSVGNHGRTTKLMRSTTATEHSLEWNMYAAISHHFRDEPRITIYNDKSAHQYLTIYNWDFHFHHGHEVNYQGGVGGIMIPMRKATDGWDKARRCHYHCFGHFHQLLVHRNIMVNGSLIGFDGYAHSKKFEPEPPQQAFTLIDSKRGRCVFTPIWVGDPSQEKKLWRRVQKIYEPNVRPTW